MTRASAPLRRDQQPDPINPTFRALLTFKALLVEGTGDPPSAGLDLRHEQVDHHGLSHPDTTRRK